MKKIKIKKRAQRVQFTCSSLCVKFQHLVNSALRRKSTTLALFDLGGVTTAVSHKVVKVQHLDLKTVHWTRKVACVVEEVLRRGGGMRGISVV